MSDTTIDRGGAEHGARGAAATAIFLWLAVAAGLAYGLVNTFKTVVDLFSG